jgi:superfamily I DNA/RNA helicase
MQSDYGKALGRLVALGGTDEGFYLLALHSFLEGFSNTIKEGFSYYANFPDVIDLLLDYLEKRNRLDFRSRQALIRIAKEHDLANRVRHQFKPVTKDEAVAATYNFLAFCVAFGIESPTLSDLRSSLSLFDEPRPNLELVKELERTRMKLKAKEAGETALIEKVSKYEEMESQLSALTSKDAEYRTEIERLRKTADQRGERLDELRQKIFEVSKERDKILDELDKQRDVGEYLQYLERFTQLTRTRLDYERSVMKLSPEQEETVGLVRDSGDYLIKGSAGTGKTLVLLHALERYMGSAQPRLDLGQPQKIVLLTYTNTLVKYSRYLAHIVGRNETDIMISTADSQLFGILKTVVHGAWIDFKAPACLIGEYNATSFLSDAELGMEIEDVIWGNLINREEYLEKHILRRGMKQPLSAQQRELVWSIQEKLRENLIAAKRYTRNLACAIVLKAMESDPEAITLRCDRIFIDEAQDLSTAIIRCMKQLSVKGAVLAADDGQSIYKIGAQYQRAGLAIAGHTRILRSNFRNTRQIHELAERFLAAGAAFPSQDERGALANREGPGPELVTAKSEAELLEHLMRYVTLATLRLGYDPENIGILTPSNASVDLIKTRLAGIGRSAASIKDEKFDFTSPGIIRLSTLHSSKGIEFPVVFIYAPSLKSTGDFDEKTSLAMQRNLLYVALTRAMDNVVVFTLEEPESTMLQELITEMRREKQG